MIHSGNFFFSAISSANTTFKAVEMLEDKLVGDSISEINYLPIDLPAETKQLSFLCGTLRLIGREQEHIIPNSLDSRQTGHQHMEQGPDIDRTARKGQIHFNSLNRPLHGSHPLEAVPVLQRQDTFGDIRSLVRT